MEPAQISQAEPQLPAPQISAQIWSGANLAIALCVALTALIFSSGWLRASKLEWFYISRLLLPMVGCGVGVAIAGYWAIPWLRILKTGQIIREDGPQAHLKKGGTPTMGGIFVLAIALPGGLIWAYCLGEFNQDILAASLLTFGFGFVGWLDDWQILQKKSNKGISPKTKLALLTVAASSFCGWLFWAHPEISLVSLPANLVLPLGLLIFPLAIFVLLGTSNATNFTDGLDGLAGGTGAVALLGMAILSFDRNPAIAIFAAALTGSYLGFLYHNHNPAQVFMGDTGSLALGGGLAAIALITNLMWGLLIVGLIFVWEALSVILQVSYFKLTKRQGEGKRLFRMAPFHHHLELSGWHETQVVGAFYLVGLLLVTVAIALQQL
jgi:phospho-N-acetylmuramoyl-pentapeptide-transferase